MQPTPQSSAKILTTSRQANASLLVSPKNRETPSCAKRLLRLGSVKNRCVLIVSPEVSVPEKRRGLREEQGEPTGVLTCPSEQDMRLSSGSSQHVVPTAVIFFPISSKVSVDT